MKTILPITADDDSVGGSESEEKIKDWLDCHRQKKASEKTKLKTLDDSHHQERKVKVEDQQHQRERAINFLSYSTKT